MVIFASEKNRVAAGGPLHTNFKISKSGAKLALSNLGVTNDIVVFGLQLQDKSIGRAPSGSANWTLTAPTPGSNNVALALGSTLTLKYNEWLATNSAGANEDWLELYNPDTNVVNLGNLVVSGKLTNPTTDGAMPALSFIEGLGFFKFTC